MASQPSSPPPSPPPETPIPTAIPINSKPLDSFLEDDDSDRSKFAFALKISEKLTKKNFLLWRQQVEPYINAHNLDGFIVAPIVPPHFLTAQDRATGTLNPAFRKWRLTDQMLLSWLQSTLSSAILARFIGCSHGYELWDKIVAYFHKQMCAKARQLCVELRSTSLANLTVQAYLLRIRDLVDNLASIGDPVPVNQHLDVILEGLPQDFSPVISVVESKFDVIDIDEVESLLLAHETRLDKFKKKVLQDVASIKLYFIFCIPGLICL